MLIVAIANHKGGIGKTTVTRNLAQTLADGGHPVLAVDCDPQGSLTRAFDLADDAPGLADVIGGDRPGRTPLVNVMVEISPTLHVCPSGPHLGDNEIAAINRLGRENMIKKALAALPQPPAPALCLLDCPPSLGLLTVNALTAADGVLIVTKSGDFEAGALLKFMQTVDSVQAELNPSLDTLGIVLNEYASQGTFDADTLAAMRSAGLHVIAAIGRTVAIKRAATARLALAHYDKSNPRNGEYNQLAHEVIKWAKQRSQ